MKTYEIAISFSAGFVLEIEAESEEQAKEQALDKANGMSNAELATKYIFDDIEPHAEIVR